MRNFNIVFAIVLIALAWACAWLLVGEPDENQLPNRPRQAEAQPTIDSDDVETPDKPAYTPPEQPITTGALAEKFFKNPKTITIQMLNRETDEPIIARAKLWPLDLARRRIAETYDDDDEKARPIRTARPDRLGHVEIALEVKAGKVLFYEFPVPTGFQPEQDPFELYSTLKKGEVTKLYYMPKPRLRVQVIDPKGQPVEGASVYALVKSVPESLHAWADLQSLYSRGDWAEPENGISAVSNEAIQDVVVDYADWRGNPFQAAMTASRFVEDFYESALTSIHSAKTNVEGWCELPNMHSGNWLVVGFNEGSKDVQTEVSLANDLAEVTLSVDPQPVARIVIDVTRATLAGEELTPDSDYAELFRIGQDPRMFDEDLTEIYDTEFYCEQETERIEILTTEASLWRFVFDYSFSITIQSILGQTTYYTLHVPHGYAFGKWQPTFKVGGEIWKQEVPVYRDGVLEYDTFSGDDFEATAGKYQALLPDGTWHNFTIITDKTLKETIEVSSAVLEITLDEFIAGYDYGHYVIWAGREFSLKAKEFQGGARLTAIIPAGFADYKFANEFVGSIFVESGQTVKLTFSKKFCSGYERLKVIDDTSEGEEYSDLENWDHPKYETLGPYEESSVGGTSIGYYDDSVVNSTPGFEILEFEVSDRETVFFGLAGWSLLKFGSRKLPVKLPGAFVITDYNLEEDENSYGSVRFTTDEDWDYEGHTIDNRGVTRWFYDEKRLPIGRYSVALWRSKDIGGDYQVEFGTTEINVTARELILDASDFKWVPCVKVELEFHGLGKLSEKASQWWTGYPDVILENLKTNSWHDVGSGEIVSYEPSVRRTVVYLAPGQYVLRAQSGSTPEVVNRVNVTPNGPRKFIIKDRP